jgi:hypothetical protein
VPSGPTASDVQTGGVVALKHGQFLHAMRLRNRLRRFDSAGANRNSNIVRRLTARLPAISAPSPRRLADALIPDAVIIVCLLFRARNFDLSKGHLFVNDVLLNESGMKKPSAD